MQSILVTVLCIELFFSGNGTVHITGLLKVHQLMHGILGSKAIGVHVVLMLVHPADQVTGYADIEGVIGGAGQDIDIVHGGYLFFRGERALRLRLRRAQGDG